MLKADVYLWSAHRDGGEGDARTAKNALVDIQNNISRSNLDLMDTYQGVFAYDNKVIKRLSLPFIMNCLNTICGMEIMICFHRLII